MMQTVQTVSDSLALQNYETLTSEIVLFCKSSNPITITTGSTTELHSSKYLKLIIKTRTGCFILHDQTAENSHKKSLKCCAVVSFTLTLQRNFADWAEFQSPLKMLRIICPESRLWRLSQLFESEISQQFISDSRNQCFCAMQKFPGQSLCLTADINTSRLQNAQCTQEERI